LRADAIESDESVEVKTPCSNLVVFRIMFEILVLTLVLFREPRVRRVGIRIVRIMFTAQPTAIWFSKWEGSCSVVSVVGQAPVNETSPNLNRRR